MYSLYRVLLIFGIYSSSVIIRIVEQREAAAQAVVQYHQEIEDLQHRFDTALAEMQNVSEQKEKIQEEQHHLQEECIMLQQQVGKQQHKQRSDTTKRRVGASNILYQLPMHNVLVYFFNTAVKLEER